MNSDADRWDRHYRGTPLPTQVDPPEIVRSELGWAGPETQALDIACGFGDAGLSLAGQGCNVTFVDVSAVAIAGVSDRARSATLAVETSVLDLAVDPLPPGPWDLVVCVHYLDRSLLAGLSQILAPGGVVALSIATTTNRERHERPSARYLLEPDELPSLVPGLRVRRHDEQWRANGVHEAWLVAVRD